MAQLGRLRLWPRRRDTVLRSELLRARKAHEEALDRGVGVLKNEHKTAITEAGAGVEARVVKHYRYMGLRFFLKGLLVTHPGRRSLRAARALTVRGLPTPRPIGLLERRFLGLVVESWYVCEAWPDARPADRYMARHFSAGCDTRRRRAFLLAFAATLQRLMASGLLHRDLKTCNILVREEGDGWSFGFIDLDDVRTGPPTRSVRRPEWVLALAQLNPSTPKSIPWTDRLRFLDAIEELEAFDRRELITEVQEISRRRRRCYFTDEGVVEEDFR